MDWKNLIRIYLLNEPPVCPECDKQEIVNAGYGFKQHKKCENCGWTNQ